MTGVQTSALPISYQKHAARLVYLDYLEVLDGDVLVTVLTGHLQILDAAGRIGVRTRRTDAAVNGTGTVRHFESMMIPTLDNAGETSAFGHARHSTMSPSSNMEQSITLPTS